MLELYVQIRQNVCDDCHTKNITKQNMTEETHPKIKQPRKKCSYKTPSTTTPVKKVRRSPKSSKDKGKVFRSFLNTFKEEEPTECMQKDDRGVETKGRKQVPVARGESSDEATTYEVKSDTMSTAKPNTVLASEIVEVDNLSSDEDWGTEESILRDVSRRDDRFCNSRRTLGYATFPEVDATIQMCSTLNGHDVADPLKVTRLPPFSLIEQAGKDCREATSPGFIVHFQSLGNFDRRGIRILHRFHQLRQLRNEVQYEEKWLPQAFSNIEDSVRDEVTYALLDRVNEEEKHLVCYKDYRVTSQELSVLCGERYLSDEIINLLIQRYCDRANEKQHSCRFILLPSFSFRRKCFKSSG